MSTRPVCEGYTDPNKTPLRRIDFGEHVISMLATGTGLIIATGHGYLRKYDFDLFCGEGDLGIYDPRICMWKAEEREHYGRMCLVREGVIAVGYEDDYNFDLFDESTGNKLRELRWIEKEAIVSKRDGPHPAKINMMTLTKEGHLLMVHADGVVNLWEIETWQVIRSFIISQRAHYPGYAAGDVTVHDLIGNGEPSDEHRGPGTGYERWWDRRFHVYASVYADCGDVVICGDRTTVVFNVMSGKMIKTLDFFPSTVAACKVSDDLIALGSCKRGISTQYGVGLFSTRTWLPVGKIMRHYFGVSKIAVVRPGLIAVSGSPGITFWDIETCEKREEYMLRRGKPGSSMSFSRRPKDCFDMMVVIPGNKFVVSGHFDSSFENPCSGFMIWKGTQSYHDSRLLIY